MIATDPLSLLFAGSFLIGLVFLVIMALLGNIGHGQAHGIAHHVGHAAGHNVGHTTHAPTGAPTTHEAAHGGHKVAHHVSPGAQNNFFAFLSYINPISIALFLVGFGFFGYIFHTASFSMLITLILAGGGGLVIAALLLVLVARFFGDSEGATVQDVSDRTGLLGKVSITIQPRNIGEIIYVSPGGMRKSIPARSVDGRRLERDQEVVVVNYQHGIAEVDTWEHFVNEERAEHGEKPDTDEIAALRALLDESQTADADHFIEKE